MRFRGYALSLGRFEVPHRYLPTLRQVERTNLVTSPGQLLPSPDTAGAHGERRYSSRPGPDPAATAWRFPGGAAREPFRYLSGSMAPKGPSASIRTRWAF
jgi:hypothetical protein